MIKEFIKDYKIKKVVDLGCGDFSIASKFVTDIIDYCGIDIVEDMINKHNQEYGGEKIHFQALDIVEDDLPKADLCLIRQVLQHLSNNDIKKVLSKIGRYKYVMITEHVTQDKYVNKYNEDMMVGSWTRKMLKSGIYIDKEPFNIKCSIILQLPYGAEEEIVTYLIDNTKYCEMDV